MIVSDEILKRELIKQGKPSRLKTGTFDLTIGEIFPVGRDQANANSLKSVSATHYSLAPQEMVWVISKQHFNMPENVTGLTTLRTTFTHHGLLALNVGIIDSHFQGQISTAIINFSDRTRTISVDQPFFRVMFFEHDPVDEPEERDRPSTSKTVWERAAGDFPKNFLNLPGSNDNYYGDQLSKLVFGFVKSRPLKSLFIGVFIAYLSIGVYPNVTKFLSDVKSGELVSSSKENN